MSPGTAPDPPQATRPPPATVPNRRHLLGLRVAAALIDVALLAGLFIIVGLAIGETPAQTLPPGDFKVSVGAVAAGAWWIRFGEVTVAGWWLAGYLAGLAILGLSIRVTSGGALHQASAGSSQACHGVSFRHPAGWREGPVHARAGNNNQLCRTAMFIGPSDAILIEAFTCLAP